MAIDVNAFAKAIRLSVDNPTGVLLDDATRLLAYCEAAIDRYAGVGTVPDSIRDVAIIQLGQYLYDAPVAERTRPQSAIANSGTKAMLAPYRVHRAGVDVDAVMDGMPAGSGIDRDSVVTIINELIPDWVLTNATAIPASKLVNAPSGGMGTGTGATPAQVQLITSTLARVLKLESFEKALRTAGSFNHPRLLINVAIAQAAYRTSGNIAWPTDDSDQQITISVNPTPSGTTATYRFDLTDLLAKPSILPATQMSSTNALTFKPSDDSVEYFIGRSGQEILFSADSVGSYYIALTDEEIDLASWARESNADPIPTTKIPAAIARTASVLSTSQVDARVAAGVADWAEEGNTTAIPAGKLANAPSSSGGGSSRFTEDQADAVKGALTLPDTFKEWITPKDAKYTARQLGVGSSSTVTTGQVWRSQTSTYWADRSSPSVNMIHQGMVRVLTELKPLVDAGRFRVKIWSGRAPSSDQSIKPDDSRQRFVRESDKWHHWFTAGSYEFYEFNRNLTTGVGYITFTNPNVIDVEVRNLAELDNDRVRFTGKAKLVIGAFDGDDEWVDSEDVFVNLNTRNVLRYDYTAVSYSKTIQVGPRLAPGDIYVRLPSATMETMARNGHLRMLITESSGTFDEHVSDTWDHLFTDASHVYYLIKADDIPAGSVIKVQEYKTITIDPERVDNFFIPADWAKAGNTDLIPASKVRVVEQLATELMDTEVGLAINTNANSRSASTALTTPLTITDTHGLLLVSVQWKVAPGSTAQLALGGSASAGDHDDQRNLAYHEIMALDNYQARQAFATYNIGVKIGDVDVFNVVAGNRGSLQLGTVSLYLVKDSSGNVGYVLDFVSSTTTSPVSGSVQAAIEIFSLPSSAPPPAEAGSIYGDLIATIALGTAQQGSGQVVNITPVLQGTQPGYSVASGTLYVPKILPDGELGWIVDCTIGTGVNKRKASRTMILQTGLLEGASESLARNFVGANYKIPFAINASDPNAQANDDTRRCINIEYQRQLTRRWPDGLFFYFANTPLVADTVLEIYKWVN